MFTVQLRGNDAQFIDRSVGTPVAWAWDFGDDEISAERNPVHTFPNSQSDEIYVVTLVVTDSRGRKARAVKQVLVPVGGYVGEVTYTRLLGEATLYGVTEFADVSDPPRKYKLLQSNHGGFWREAGGLTDLIHWPDSGDRVEYDTSGTRLSSMAVNDGDVGSDAFVGPSPVLSYEDVDYATYAPDWTDYPPDWVRSKTQKYFTGFTEAPGESATFRGWAGSWGRFGIQGNSIGIRLSYPTWVTDHWEVTVALGGDGQTTGFSATGAAHLRATPGDADPGVPSASDPRILYGDPGLTANGFLVSTVLVIPPDTSINFYCIRNKVPNIQIFPRRYSDPQTTEETFQSWLYFPATEGELPVWRYAEQLAAEDTLEAGLLRGAYTTDTEGEAETTGVSGGSTAESHSPLVIDAKLPTAHINFVRLTAGHEYQWTITFQTNTIGDTDYATFTESDTFVADDVTYTQDWPFTAPAGKQQRILLIEAVDLGEYVPPTPPPTYQAETMSWWIRALSNGGTVDETSLEICDGLVVALKAANLWDRIAYLLPFLGADFAAAEVPLIDVFFRGPLTNSGFVDADYSLATGLQGAAGKHLVTSFTATTEFGSGNGSFFHWELDYASTGTPVWGANGPFFAALYYLYIGATLQRFFWDRSGAANAEYVAPAANTLYLGQRNSDTSHKLYASGVLVASDTTLEATGVSSNTMWYMGYNPSGGYPNRSGCGGYAYSDLTDDENLALYETLRDYLMTPTGRI